MDSDAPAQDDPSRGPPQRRVPLGWACAAVCSALLLAHLVGEVAGEVAGTVAHVGPNAMAPPVVIASMLASELTLLGIALATPLLAARSVPEALDLAPARPRLFAAAAVGTVMLGPLGDRLMTWFSALFPRLTLGVVPALHELAQQLPGGWLWPTFALVPGVAEELLFRGVLQGAIRRPRLGVAISGVAFALFHIDPVHVIGVLPLGLFLAWVAHRSSTTVTVGAHVINNSVALIGIRNSALDVGFGANQPVPTGWLLASLGLFALALSVVLHDTHARV